MIKHAKAFIIKASTIILVMNTFVWFTQAYGWNLQMVEDSSGSILASIGNVIAPLLIPLGFSKWQPAAAAFTGFVAKENVVSTLAITIAASSEEVLSLPGGVLTQFFTPVTAYAFLVFNLFIPPCFAAIGAMYTELVERKWLLRALAFQFSVGYLLAMLVTQIGTIILYGKLATGFVAACIILILYAIVIYYLIKRTSSGKIQFSTVTR